MLGNRGNIHVVGLVGTRSYLVLLTCSFKREAMRTQLLRVFLPLYVKGE